MKREVLDFEKKVFISYRRDSAEDFARDISQKLSDRGCKVFYDHDALQTENEVFWKRISEEVKNSDYFLLIISETTFDERILRDNSPTIQDYVKFEIGQALECGIPIIPILIHGCAFPTDLPQEIKNVMDYTALEVKQAYYKESMKVLFERLKLPSGNRKRLTTIISLCVFVPLLVIGIVHGVRFQKPQYAVESFSVFGETENLCYDELFVFSGKSLAPIIRIYITGNNFGNPSRKLLAQVPTENGEFRYETTGELWWYGATLVEIVPCDEDCNEMLNDAVQKEITIDRKGTLDAFHITNDSYRVKCGDSVTITWTETYYPKGITYTVRIIPEDLFQLGNTIHINDSVLYKEGLEAGEYILSEADTLRIPAGEYVIMVSSAFPGYTGCVDVADLTVEE